MPDSSFSHDPATPPGRRLTGGEHLSLGRRVICWLERIPRRLTRIPDSPHEIAKAFAVGVFIGILPGLGPIAAILLAATFRLNKSAALMGSLTTNPWTIAGVYASSYKVGEWVLGVDHPVHWATLYKFHPGWYQEMSKVFPALLVGGSVVGVCLALIAYAVVYSVLNHYRMAHLKKRSAP